MLNLGQVAAVGALVAGSIGAAFYEPFGNYTIVREGPRRNDVSVRLTSDTQEDEPYAGVSFTPPSSGSNAVKTLDDITWLSATYRVTEGGTGGGSPRFEIALDEDGDGESDGNVFVYIGPYPHFTAPPGDWTSTGNVAGTTEQRVDTSQIGGTFYDDWEGAEDLAGDAEVLEVSFVVDAGWFFQDGVQTVLLNRMQVCNAVYAPTVYGRQ